MDGKGAWRDNDLVESLWRSIKYEQVDLRTYASVFEARAGVGSYLGFYNLRPHSSLDRKTPDQAPSTSRCSKPRRHMRGGHPFRKHPKPAQTIRTTFIATVTIRGN